MNPVLFFRRLWAFVVRDWRLELSYRMQFFLRILSILIVVTTLFFISKILPALLIHDSPSGEILWLHGSLAWPCSTTS